MNQFRTALTEKRAQQVMDALRANNMEAFYAASADEVVPFVQKLLPAGCTVGCGGSMTLGETGVTALLESGAYNYLDRAKTAPEQMDELYRACFSADWYLTSANAITMDGQLYNVDGNANRVAAIAFGPTNVLVIVGVNKLVSDLHAAEVRVRELAAPANAMRLNCKTPCASTGRCANCRTPSRICCDTLVSGYQRRPGRIKVLLVGQELGL